MVEPEQLVERDETPISLLVRFDRKSFKPVVNGLFSDAVAALKFRNWIGVYFSVHRPLCPVDGSSLPTGQVYRVKWTLESAVEAVPALTSWMDAVTALASS